MVKSASRSWWVSLWYSYLKKNMFILLSLVAIQYCEKAPRPRGSLLGLRSPWFEVRILCLEGSVI